MINDETLVLNPEFDNIKSSECIKRRKNTKAQINLNEGGLKVLKLSSKVKMIICAKYFKRSEISNICAVFGFLEDIQKLKIV
ncbi:hypothetical protein I9T54_04690 [Campylobacter peloridis]|uniref:hypothetical protein n=1 Tax=Campylobacter peloridis TaxID=488546 RepID=UPI001C72B31E|nr:hypothetical protein [Campylobacter peloridis]MBX2078829.1 hypothetical protein [Campylobacter peloridis]